MKRGAFIALEGPAGAGKSLQAERLSTWLASRGVPHILTREPGGTPHDEALRGVILERPDLRIDGVGELFLLSAARHAHVESVIRPALELGRAVICDRYELSTQAYQGWGRGVAMEIVREVTRIATGGLLPDLYIVLDVPVKIGRDRQRAPGFRADRIEREDESFMERVRAGYRDLTAADPRAVVIDAGSKTPEQIAAEIQAEVGRRFPAMFEGAAPPD